MVPSAFMVAEWHATQPVRSDEAPGCLPSFGGRAWQAVPQANASSPPSQLGVLRSAAEGSAPRSLPFPWQ